MATSSAKTGGSNTSINLVKVLMNKEMGKRMIKRHGKRVDELRGMGKGMIKRHGKRIDELRDMGKGFMN